MCLKGFHWALLTQLLMIWHLRPNWINCLCYWCTPLARNLLKSTSSRSKQVWVRWCFTHLQKQPNHVKNLLSVVLKRTASDAANAKKHDSNILNCVNAVVDAQIWITDIYPEGGFPLILSIQFLYFFRKNTKFSIDWYITWSSLENLIFHPMGSPQGIFCLEEVFLLILSIWSLYFSEST